MKPDGFKIDRYLYYGIYFDCPEHALWWDVFRRLKQKVEYQPKVIRIEVPSTARYKVEEKLEWREFKPAFYLEGLGYLEVTDGPPSEWTTHTASLAAKQEEESVFILQDEPQLPWDWKPAINEIIAIHEERLPMTQQRFRWDGRKLSIGPFDRQLCSPFEYHNAIESALATVLVSQRLKAKDSTAAGHRISV